MHKTSKSIYHNLCQTPNNFYSSYFNRPLILISNPKTALSLRYALYGGLTSKRAIFITIASDMWPWAFVKSMVLSQSYQPVRYEKATLCVYPQVLLVDIWWYRIFNKTSQTCFRLIHSSINTVLTFEFGHDITILKMGNFRWSRFIEIEPAPPWVQSSTHWLNKSIKKFDDDLVFH